MQHHTGNPQQDLAWSKILSKKKIPSKKRVKSKALGILCPIEMSENNCSSVGKESACNAGDQVRSLGRKEPLGKEMANHSSILPCLENPLDRGAWWATVHGITKSRHTWATDTFTFSLRLREFISLVLEVKNRKFPSGPVVDSLLSPLSLAKKKSKTRKN